MPLNSVDIVHASPDEYGEIAEFARRTYEHAFGKEMGVAALDQHFAERMTDRCFRHMLSKDKFILARSDTQLVGYAQHGGVDSLYSKYVGTLDHAGHELRRLYVKPDAQSCGIGSALMERVIAEIIQNSSNNLYLTTWQTNSGAIKFYQKHGFKKVGEMPEYDDSGALNGYEHIMLRSIDRMSGS